MEQPSEGQKPKSGRVGTSLSALDEGARYSGASDSAAFGGPKGRRSTERSNPSPPPSDVDQSRSSRGHKVIRREAFRLRTGQRGLVFDHHKALALCGLGRKPIPGEPDGLDWATLQCTGVGDGAKAEVRGTLRCGSPWACPVCAPKLASARARVLGPQIASRLDAGWRAFFITLTVRHQRLDLLEDLFSGLSKAWAKLTSGKGWKTLTREGRPEFVRGYDLTWSPENGWHPHVHVVLLVPPSADGKKMADGMAVRWRSMLSNLGFDALPQAQDVQECHDAEEAAAYAVAPAAVYEATSLATKKARKGNSGLTAFDILRAAVPEKGEPDPAMVARWCEYIAAVKGRRQTTVSRGLTLDEDKVLIEIQEEEEAQLIAELGPETISELDRSRRLAELLEVVEESSPSMRRDAAFLVLSTLRSGDWAICREIEPIPKKRSVAEEYSYRPPEEWISPITKEGRLWRKVTKEDRGILMEMGTSF